MGDYLHRSSSRMGKKTKLVLSHSIPLCLPCISVCIFYGSWLARVMGSFHLYYPLAHTMDVCFLSMCPDLGKLYISGPQAIDMLIIIAQFISQTFGHHGSVEDEAGGVRNGWPWTWVAPALGPQDMTSGSEWSLPLVRWPWRWKGRVSNTSNSPPSRNVCLLPLLFLFVFKSFNLFLKII